MPRHWQRIVLCAAKGSMPKIPQRVGTKPSTMSINLEIRDGSPHWYLSPDIWVLGDPGDTTESMPVAGIPCYLKARVRNNGSSPANNATVNFYWGNPAVGVSRATATFIGQSFVSLAAGASDDVLCLVPWIPQFLNEGHECILAEAFHPDDPLATGTDFHVPTDRHVAQRNLSVIQTQNNMFHLNFELHNGTRKEQTFVATIEQVSAEKALKHFPAFLKQLKGKKEGKISATHFSNSRCPEPGKQPGQHQEKCEPATIAGFGTRQLAVTGKLEGDFAFVTIARYNGSQQTGGLGILILNSKA